MDKLLKIIITVMNMNELKFLFLKTNMFFDNLHYSIVEKQQYYAHMKPIITYEAF